ncbi:gliding motility-associated lipoprotein GldD [Arenibacter nanhaiticus]|uniref:Gliding motility-associated lipoprotein GldD n=1 Tax=Arenibacter nanhaiticus TaxID=558155 RepID=A0A1M6JKI9_9FLAO|nr:gliding motility lipoprotein GldD [Arenibacter nanhaiticus]SHJ47197.1 gliding motility-associated lipoprotein GldD [Arenibacter nanhaiticus]
MKFNALCLSVLISFMTLSCQEDTLPKPKAMLRLEYPETGEKQLTTPHFEFRHTGVEKTKSTDLNSVTINYPKLNGAIFITYKKIDGNLEKLLTDAQKLSYEHVMKADGIMEKLFVNDTDKVYGMYYEVKGNAASQSQFYVTDSLRHFLTGSLYFNAKPNYDSILPAAAYLQKDIRNIMESLQWKEQP